MEEGLQVQLRLFAGRTGGPPRNDFARDELALSHTVRDNPVRRSEGLELIDPLLYRLDVSDQFIDAPPSQLCADSLGEGFVGFDGMRTEVAAFLALDLESVAQRGYREAGESFVDFGAELVGFLAGSGLGFELDDVPIGIDFCTFWSM